MRGRLDHLAVDLTHGRIFVAELGNDSVGVVDLKSEMLLRTLTGFKEPQELAYLASADTLYVANAGDGSVQVLQGADLLPVARIELGADADNVRVDENAHRLYVGYGNGGLAVIDTERRERIAEFSLPSHPESFQMDPSSPRVFINISDSHEVAVMDRVTNRLIEQWSTDSLRENYPMALDGPAQLLVAFRHPAALGTLDKQTGVVTATASLCGDSDDVFVDSKRGQVYVSCGVMGGVSAK